MGFPRVSETFIASEIHRVEQGGRPAEAVRDQARRGARAGARPSRAGRDRRAARVPARPGRAHEADAPVALGDVRAFVPALRRCARRRPHGVARAARTALAQAFRDRRAPLAGPRKIYVKELIQAITLADRLLQEPDVRHLHAHFAHGTTTITWLAACISGLPFSFTGHARDIYAPELNPRAGCGASSTPRGSWSRARRRTSRHLQAIATARRGAPRLPRPVRGLHAAARAGPPAAGDNGHLRVLGVGRLVAKKGFDTLVDACALLDARGVPFEALIVGQDDKDGKACARTSSGRRARWRCPARSARRSCSTSTAARARCACRRGCSPTTATASRTCWWRRWPRARRWWPATSPASPNWWRTRSTACSSRPTTRRPSPTRSSASTRTARWPTA